MKIYEFLKISFLKDLWNTYIFHKGFMKLKNYILNETYILKLMY